MEQKIHDIFAYFINEELQSAVLHRSTDEARVKKVTIRPIAVRSHLCYQISASVGNQVLHENLTAEELLSRLPEWFNGLFTRAELTGAHETASILIGKRGTVSITKHRKAGEKPTEAPREHNRKKHYILEEGKPVPFLIDLGVMNTQGFVVKAYYDKFRQINRFLEFVADVTSYLPQDRPVTILDFGCGKSYLTFAVYYYLHELCGYPLSVVGLDLKQDVIAHCSKLADKYGYTGLKFLQGDIAKYQTELAVIDMVITLHACDTATDYALYRAIEKQASVILSVPCCQHELNQQISCEPLSSVFRYGIVQERTAALFTDALRAELLELHGYHAQILEFIEMEHTPKNLLIRAVRRNGLQPVGLRKKRKEEYRACTELLQVKPLLETLLAQN